MIPKPPLRDIRGRRRANGSGEHLREASQPTHQSMIAFLTGMAFAAPMPALKFIPFQIPTLVDASLRL